jgi:monofunctional chorismate mutase
MEELIQLRSRIDEIDKALLRLFIERMNVVKELAVYKREHGASVLDERREKEILEKMRKSGGVMEPYVEKLFRMLISLSREYQLELGGKDGKA